MSHHSLILTIEKTSCMNNTVKQTTTLSPNCNIPRTTQQGMRQIFNLTTRRVNLTKRRVRCVELGWATLMLPDKT